MFCEKCGTQFPDGQGPICPTCRARMGAQPQQPMQQPMQRPMQQPMQQQYQQPYQQPYGQQPYGQQPYGQPYPGMRAAGGNTSFLFRLIAGIAAFIAGFNPLLPCLAMSIIPFNALPVMTAMPGFFVPTLILMIVAICAGGFALVAAILSKVSPGTKLPIPPLIMTFASAGSGACSMVTLILSAAFAGTSRGLATIDFLWVLCMLFAVAAIFFPVYTNFIKKN